MSLESIRIITDSHSGITQQQAKEMGIDVLPMPFFINEECYEEEITLSRELFFEKMEAGAKVSTSQPSLPDVMALWDKALESYDTVIYMPISSGLSGSCATATALASDEKYEGKVFVVDNGRIATPLIRAIMDAKELIEEGYSAREIKDILEAAKNDMIIYLSVENLEYLKRGGRISAATAAIGTLLNIKPVLRFNTKLIESFSKCRGSKKARKLMIETVRHDMETTFKEQYENGEIYLMTASNGDEETAQVWVKEVQAAFPEMNVLYGPLSLGISCHTGPNAVGIGFSCRPKR